MSEGTNDFITELLGTSEDTTTPTTPIEEEERLSFSIDTLLGTGTSYLDERIRKTVSLSKLETLYHSDGLTFRIVQEYINGLLGSGFYFKCEDDKINTLITEWSDEIGLRFLLEESIRDIYVYGNAWVEIVPDTSMTTVAKLIMINPKTMDYIRDRKTKNVLLDEYGNFLGYEQQKEALNKKIRWYKDRIEEVPGNGDADGELIYKAKSSNEDCRDRIAHLKLYGMGDSFLGITPLEVAYKVALIRMNIEDTLGETAFRGGGLVAYLEKKIGEEQKNRLVADLKNITSRNIFLFDRAITLDNIPIPDQKGRENLIYTMADEQSSAMGIPLTLVMKAMSRVYKGEKEEDAVQFELSLINLQARLAHQLRKSIIKVWCQWNKIPNDYKPRIEFIPRVPNLELSRARSVASLARWGIIRYDPELEEELRKEMDLPTTFVTKEIAKWEKENRSPEAYKTTTKEEPEDSDKEEKEPQPS